jgi:hypothetical protein
VVPAAAPAATYTANLTVTNSVTGCVSGAYAISVTVNLIPTITLGANPAVCSGTTSANLTYSATTGTPNQYSIVYSGAALGAGFVNVANAVLPVSPISLVVPAAAPAATYTANLTVTNSVTGCVSGAYAISVTVNPNPTITLGANPGVCAGTTSANLTYSATTGTPNQYSIVYSAAALGAGFVNVANAALPVSPISLVVPAAAPAATYTANLTVTNSVTGCVSGAYAISVTVNPNPTITLGANPGVCAGTTSANLTYSATTGTPNQYSIVYSAAALGAGFVNVANAVLAVSPISLVVPAAAPAATYTANLTVTNSVTGCVSGAYAISVTVNPNPTITLGTNPDVCAGTTSANLTYSATTGTPNQYSIVYSAAALGAGFVNVANAALPASPISLAVPAAAPAATYTANLTVTNSVTGCVSGAYAISVTVNLTSTITLGANPGVCSGTTSANLTYSATTGTPNQYSIVYSAAAITAGFANVTNAVLPASQISLVVPAAAPAATYTGVLTVSNSVTGCLSGGYVISVTVVALPTTPGIAGGGKTAMCRATNGQFYSVPLNPGNTYTWSIAPATPIALGGNATDNFIVLNFPNPGVYTLSVREFTPAPLGCAGPIQTLTITVYDNPVTDAGPARTICAGAPTTLGGAPTASGGSGTFTYLWTPSFGLDDATLPNPVATTNATRTYTLNVNDVISGCATVIKSVVVTVNPLPTVYNVTGPDYYCFGTPGITLTLSGSQIGVDYQLYKNAVISGAAKPGTGGGLNWPGLTTGTYTVKATNAITLCVNDMNGSVTVAENPDVIINSITPVEPSCFSSSDGVISISASGGTGALLYSVNNGATYQSSGTFGSLPQGTYNIIVKDTRGCTKAGIQVLTQPPALSITSITVTNSITCFGGSNGSARVVVAGGTPIYTYQWYTDSGLTSPIVGQVTDEVTGRAAGTYYVKITDFNGCWIFANITLTQPAVLNAVVTPTNVTCNGVPDGIINITAPTGGSGAYEYSKDGGSGWQVGGLFNALAPATYDVRIRDLANPTCAITLNSSLIITQPNVLSAVVTSTNVTCNLAGDGTITVSSPTGGYGTYDYSIGGLWQATGTFTGLTPATYVVSIRDRAHPACVIVLDPTRIITEPAALSATLNSTNITCFSANNGTITITAPLGGSGTYQYTVNGGTTWQSSGSFTNLAPAIAYNVRMRDAVNTGCTLTLNGTLTLTQPNILSATVTSTNVTCSGAGDGTITITNPLGGYGTYDYTVDGGTTWQPGGNFTALIPGFYNVQIRDRANPACVIIVNGSLQITQPAVLSANVAKTNVTCNGANDGTITISSPSGGYGTY